MDLGYRRLLFLTLAAQHASTLHACCGGCFRVVRFHGWAWDPTGWAGFLVLGCLACNGESLQHVLPLLAASFTMAPRLADRTGDEGPFLPGMLPDLSWPQTQLREVRAKHVDASCGSFIVTRPSWMGTYPDMHAIYVGGAAVDWCVSVENMRVPWRELGACESVGCRQGCCEGMLLPSQVMETEDRSRPVHFHHHLDFGGPGIVVIVSPLQEG